MSALITPHQKWWRWLGEPSESGGTIGGYEGGMYAGTGVWRPTGSRTADPVALAGNTIDGPLSCSGNAPAPVDLEAPNRVTGPRSGQ
ncbi:hypothetical protein ACFV9C_29935 [Kribbella sp. NPDC059898]|uniref:hypothetical protein n=1 Tax=Kribbella sp. NPDC059898 TaxID=3346995 RepID=UPI00364E5AEC